MTSNFQQNTFIVNFSNNKRKYIENQKANPGMTFRKNSAFELLVFQYIPVIGASTLLAPFNRLKVLLQVQDFIPLPKTNGTTTIKTKTKISELIKSNKNI
jgi:hypothetical protein